MEKNTIKTESAWLIERYYQSQTCYWSCGSGRPCYDNAFCPDIGYAIRFSRKEDADAVLYRLLDGVGRVAEHVWMDKPQDTPNA